MAACLSGGGLAGLDNGSVAGWCTNGSPGAGSNTQQTVDEIHHGPWPTRITGVRDRCEGQS